MAVKTLIEAMRDGLREEMERDERVIIFGEDVGPRGGVFGVTAHSGGRCPSSSEAEVRSLGRT